MPSDMEQAQVQEAQLSQLYFLAIGFGSLYYVGLQLKPEPEPDPIRAASWNENSKNRPAWRACSEYHGLRSRIRDTKNIRRHNESGTDQ